MEVNQSFSLHSNPWFSKVDDQFIYEKLVLIVSFSIKLQKEKKLRMEKTSFSLKMNHIKRSCYEIIIAGICIELLKLTT